MVHFTTRRLDIYEGNVGNFIVSNPAKSGVTMESSIGIMDKHTCLLFNQLKRSLEQGGFNQEDIEKLRTLLGTLEKASSTCSLTLSSKFPISIRLKVSDETFANS